MSPATPPQQGPFKGRHMLSRVVSAPEPRPAMFRMIAAAEQLAHGFDFVRVDFYQIGPTPLFGEITLYPGFGLDRFRPSHFDLLFGACWAAHHRGSPRG